MFDQRVPAATGTRLISSRLKAALAAAALLLAATIEVGAQSSFKTGPIEVSGAWARASAGPAGAGAAYFEIRNHGARADRLVSARTEVSRTASLHSHVVKDNIMRMERADGLDVAAHGRVVLKPGSHHVMLMGLAKPLMKGHSFPLTLTFEKAGTVTVGVAIMGPGARGPRPGKGGHKR